jgi:5'-nucleotidase
MDFRLSDRFDFAEGARFVARVVEEIDDFPMAPGTLLNVNCPAGDADGVEVTRLGKRIYRDQLKLTDEQDDRRRYWIYGADPGFEDEQGTDLAAVAAGKIAVTPLHFDLTDTSGMDALERRGLARLLAPAAREVE